jgi:hypothetical protein
MKSMGAKEYVHPPSDIECAPWQTFDPESDQSGFSSYDEH